MSRSYKRSVICKGQNNKKGKRLAGRTVRRASDVPNGNCFKKLYCTWDICDWRFREQSYTAEQFRKAWYDCENTEFDWRRNSFCNWKTAYRFYLKGYKRK